MNFMKVTEERFFREIKKLGYNPLRKYMLDGKKAYYLTLEKECIGYIWYVGHGPFYYLTRL